MKRWVQHSDLYARENRFSQAVLDAIENLPVLYNLDKTPTKEELKRAIGRFPSGRSPGKDAIPAKVIKYGYTTLLAGDARRMVLCHRT